MLPVRSSLRRPVVAQTESRATAEAHSSSELASSSSSTTSPGSIPSSSRSSSELKDRLRGWAEDTAISVRGRADEFTSTTKTALSQLGFHLNRITGYEEIEALKRRVVEQETRINEARNAARSAKTAYDIAVAQRSNSQREINDLLQRKSSWTQADIVRFTTLVPQDHTLEQEEVHSRAAVHDAEEAVEREFTELMRTILARYHEEQVWSDKIRSASTYGSLAALALNLLVFVTAIVFVEPWKRRRLAMTFEKKIEEMGLEHKAVVEASMTEIGRQLEMHAQRLDVLHSTAIAPAPHTTGPSQRDETANVSTRVWEKSRDPEVAGAIASAAVVAGVLGWFLQSWLGS
ncbi:sensitive to high expression protein 9 [Mycena pura]|uniref:Sensitive to high expression protein 9, mitochondrial n=1 Tax=Mycena pura TaxID=153505 RepID=A0AAD6V781_9AGAR|nr:sensitive to high expression protein 9 [Mycena pura]